MSGGDLRPLLEDIVARLGAIEGALNLPAGGGGGAAAGGAGGGAAADSRAVRAYDAYCAESLAPFMAAAEALGGGAASAAQIVQQGWDAQRAAIVTAAGHKKPAGTGAQAVLAPISEAIQAANAAIDRSDWENHLKTVAEGIQALNWIAVEPAPRDFVENFVGASDFWGNKIRVQYRKTNPEQMAFVDTFKALILNLMEYIKDHHTTGLAWNPRGDDFSGAVAAPAAAKPAAAAAAPAKPAAGGGSGGAGPAGLFDALNKGTGITSGLKKVSRDQQTWRAEYKGSDAPAPAAKAAPRPRAAPAPRTRGPPNIEYIQRGNKWMVENQTSEQGVVTVEITSMRDMVYITGCVDATIDVTGKSKSIVIDGCKKTRVLFDAAVSSCEVVNSQRIQVQARQNVPSVAIDKTDGCLVYLPREGMHATIVASKSSEMNVSFPNESGEMIELPIPEQFVYRIDQSGDAPRVVSEVSDLYA